MKILITGGLGHVGSYFLYNIHKIKKIKKVFVVDNFSTNKINSLSNLKKSKKIFLIKKDLSEKNILKKFPKTDIVLHLASIVDAEGSLAMKEKVINHNYSVFNNIINYCHKNKSKLIHISSTSVYGEQSGFLNENCQTLNPQSPYAEEKLMEERLLKKNKNKIKYVTFRFGTIAGFAHGMRFQTAVNKFCLHAILNIPLTVWKGALNQTRPYLALNEAFMTINHFIKKDLFNNQIYNVLSGNFTVEEILNLIKKYKKNIKIEFVQSKILNQVSYEISNKKVQALGVKFNKKNIENSIKDTFTKFVSINNL